MRKEGLHVLKISKRWTTKGISFLLTCFILLCPFSAFAEEPTTDYSTQSWLEAFGSLHSRISAEYAFTEWKGVDWDALGNACRAKIEQAQASDDFNAYYVALRQYGNAIPDGHGRVLPTQIKLSPRTSLLNPFAAHKSAILIRLFSMLSAVETE